MLTLAARTETGELLIALVVAIVVAAVIYWLLSKIHLWAGVIGGLLAFLIVLAGFGII